MLTLGITSSLGQQHRHMGHPYGTLLDYVHHAMYVGDVRTGVTSTDYTDNTATCVH